MKNVVGIVLGILSIVALAVSLYVMNSTPKIAYVQSQALIFGYEGTKEVQAKFNIQKQSYQSNIDTLEMDYEMAVKKYKSDAEMLTAEEKRIRELGLRNQKNKSLEYIENIQQLINTEEKELLTGALNQINALVENYGKENGYDIIFGTTSSGNLLFGQDKYDITNTVLLEINLKYKGQ